MLSAYIVEVEMFYLNRQCGMCDQQSLRLACACAQSDQSLCLSLAYYISGKLLTEHHLEFLSLKGGCTDSSESTLVKMPHCWRSHVMTRERSGSVVECLTRDPGAAGSSLTGVTALWSLSKTHLS